MESEDSINKNTSSTTVYVGELSSKTLDSDLFRIFSSIGEVLRIKLSKRAEPLPSYAFVTFANEEDAQRAVKEYNNFKLHRKSIRVAHIFDDQKKRDEANIFVKNLPPNFTCKDLYDTFSMFGKIISAKIATYPCGKSKNYGFVQFDKKKSAKLAIKHCSGVKIYGYEIHVELYNQDVRKKQEEGQKQEIQFTNCFIKNFPLTTTEDELRVVLEKFGTITSLFFPLREDTKTTKGFAFANFDSYESAINAINSLHGKYVFGESSNEDDLIKPEPFYIQKAQKKQERENELRKSFEKLSMDGQSHKRNLYITNIPKFIEKEDIVNIFKEFGTIVSVSIGSDAVNDQRKFAYICYGSSDEAFIAIERGNEIFIDGNKLHVTYFKNKTERMKEKLSQSVGFSSTIPYICNTSIKTLSNLSMNGEFSQLSSSNDQSQIHKIVSDVADTFKHQWENLEVGSREEFADKITKVICPSPGDKGNGSSDITIDTITTSKVEGKGCSSNSSKNLN